VSHLEPSGPAQRRASEAAGRGARGGRPASVSVRASVVSSSLARSAGRFTRQPAPPRPISARTRPHPGGISWATWAGGCKSAGKKKGRPRGTATCGQSREASFPLNAQAVSPPVLHPRCCASCPREVTGAASARARARARGVAWDPVAKPFILGTVPASHSVSIVPQNVLEGLPFCP